MAWFAMWIFLASNDPSDNRFIGQKETDKILRERQVFQQNNLLPPMHKILKIPTVWIIAISDFGNSVALYFIVTEGPTFMSKVLGKDITTVNAMKQYCAKVNFSIKIINLHCRMEF